MYAFAEGAAYGTAALLIFPVVGWLLKVMRTRNLGRVTRNDAAAARNYIQTDID